MNESYAPYECDLSTYEKRLATRKFWDDAGCEWERITFDGKLIILAGFVQRGGNLKRVIKRYMEGRDEMYRSRIHWVILDYVWRMMMGDEPISMNRTLSDRIKCLDNDELLELLAEELKMCVKSTTRSGFNYRGQHVIESHWIVSEEYKFDDTILDQIEREHWRANPDESITKYWNMAKRWERKYCLF